MPTNEHAPRSPWTGSGGNANLKLVIRELQQRPILWDMSLDSYRREDLKEDARKQISNVLLKENGVAVNTTELKKKLRNVIADTRKYYTAFHKRVSGAGAVNTCDQNFFFEKREVCRLFLEKVEVFPKKVDFFRKKVFKFFENMSLEKSYQKKLKFFEKKFSNLFFRKKFF